MLINFLTVALISLSFIPIVSSISINDLLSFAIVPTLLITKIDEYNVPNNNNNNNNFLTVALISLSFNPIFSSISINDLLSFATLLITKLMNTMSLVVLKSLIYRSYFCAFRDMFFEILVHSHMSVPKFTTVVTNNHVRSKIFSSNNRWGKVVSLYF